MQVGEETFTDILIKRVKEARLPIIMVTPKTPEDTQHMLPLATKHGIGYYAGANKNIIKRHIDCAVDNNVDWIINVDGDDILVCPDLITELAKMIESAGHHNCVHLHRYPLGLGLLAYSFSRLVGSRGYEEDTNWGAKVIEAGPVTELEGYRFKDCRLTLDYVEDAVVIRTVIETLGVRADSQEICKFMMEHPEICAINNFRNDEYYKRLEVMSKSE